MSIAVGLIAYASPCCSLLAQDRSSSPADDGIVHWPRLDFVIPFNIDTTGQTPREIQLELSDDGGRSWSLYSSGDVRTKQFQFRAKSDGEYRFRLKTLDNQGRVFDNPGDPLRVVVDTAKPEAKLLVDIDPSGVMQAEFELTDSAIDPSSIQLVYQTEGLSQWREISVELSPSDVPNALAGFGSWNIPNGTRQLVVRLMAKDKAGNAVEVTRLPQLPRSAAAKGSLQLASGKPRDLGAAVKPSNQAIGSGVASPGPDSLTKMADSLPKVEVLGKSRAKSTDQTALLSQLAAQQKLIEQLSQQNANPQSNGIAQAKQNDAPVTTTGANPKSGSVELPLANRVVKDFGQDKPVFNPLPKNDLVKVEVTPSKLPVREISDEELERLRSQGPVSLVAKRSEPISVVKEDSAPATLPSLSLQPEPSVTRIPGNASFRRDIKPLFSNSKAFSLDYGIENDPDSPVSTVELWGTSDEGQTWQLWGQDPDRESPFDIEVENEGLFGFRMVIIGANGLASNRPRNGDNADSWIHVDVQEPQAKIVSALYGKGKESGSLIIEYRASDDFLPERPITLAYATSPNGPWSQIATGVRNNGRFVWPADPTLPPSIFLRLEAHDSAGNIGVSQLDTPIDVQGLAPRGRIQGFRPIK